MIMFRHCFYGWLEALGIFRSVDHSAKRDKVRRCEALMKSIQPYYLHDVVWRAVCLSVGQRQDKAPCQRRDISWPSYPCLAFLLSMTWLFQAIISAILCPLRYQSLRSVC